MKVRIGYGPGPAGARDGASEGSFEQLVDWLERLGFDSLWLSERATGQGFDPLVGLAVAAGRTRRLKLGTSVLVLPGRNPVLLAKQIASLDRLSNGRMLPAVGLGVADPAEQDAFGVARGDRAGWFEEALPLLRTLWAGSEVHHEGRHFSYSGVRVGPMPVQEPLEVWMGGIAPSELARAGRLADGWLPSLCTPDEAAAGRQVIETEAAAHGRTIDREHFGALLFYTRHPLDEPFARRLASRRPGLSPEEVVSFGVSQLRGRVEAFMERGFSKFVVVPLMAVPSWRDELEDLARALLPLES